MDRQIATAMLGTFALVFLDDTRQGNVKPGAFIGLLIGFLILSFLAGPLPAVSKGFAWLIFAVTVLSRGPAVLQGFSQKG